jgi:UDP-N-acetylmuramate--alanine ligase
MIDIKDIEGIYFIGIGGIGMSALALYFAGNGYTIAGYDRYESSITHALSESGCLVSYEDNINVLSHPFAEPDEKDRIIIVYTPAIPGNNNLLSYFREKGYRVYKRAEILGELSTHTDTLAVAGTHGKTTISTMIAHLLKQSRIDCSAFLGGISKNYGTNLLIGKGRYTVMEADEFDRSFHYLEPYMAVITALDDDHLDIYGDHANMVRSYNVFSEKIRTGGTLLVNSRIRKDIVKPAGATCLTYGPDPGSDFTAFNIQYKEDYYCFSIKARTIILEDLHLTLPGKINIENMTAAVAIALMCGVTEQEIRKAVSHFRGVRRRFDVRINMPGMVYIDDYAHHPEEIKTFITSVREFYPGRKITGIFQPHLYTRTRDHASGFASSLDMLDEVILLPVYPARENPIEGISSDLILNKMEPGRARLMEKSNLPDNIDISQLDVLLTIGAGDIDTLVEPLENLIRKERMT